MIRNIIFDMGNVLIVFDPAFFMDAEGIENPDDRIIIHRELFHNVEWAQMDLGVLTEESAEPLILKRIPDRLKGPVIHLLHRWWEKRTCIDGMEELLKELKEAGYRLYLLSNASVKQHSYWPEFSMSKLFDGTLISCDVGVVKPDPVIYSLFTEKYSLLPEECLFVDDQPANVACAVRCGWHGIVFHGDARILKNKMKLYGIFLNPETIER